MSVLQHMEQECKCDSKHSVGRQEVNERGRVVILPVPGTALGVKRSGFECHGGNPQSNKTKWGCIDALSCFI